MKPQDPVLSLADGPTESASLSTRLSLTTRLSLATVALYHKTVARCQDCHSLPQDCRSLPNKTVAHYQTRLSLSTKTRLSLSLSTTKTRLSLSLSLTTKQSRSLPNKTVATKQDCRYQTRHSLCRSLPNKTRLSLSLTTKQDTLSVALYQTRHYLSPSTKQDTICHYVLQKPTSRLCTRCTSPQFWVKLETLGA